MNLELRRAVTPVDVAPSFVASLPPYLPGRPATGVPEGLEPVCMMASNENPLGTSPLAVAAMQRLATQSSSYPDPHGHALKAALCRGFGLSPDQLLLGNGSSELIDLVARTFLRAGDEAVYAQYAFMAYPLAIQLVGALAVRVPALKHGHDLVAMAKAITPRTRLVFVANPNNPTGTWFPESALREFLAEVPSHVAVVLDEAYTEYQAPAERIDSFRLVNDYPNLVVLRTFSKAYGLAGMRVGYAVAQPALAELINRVRPVFNVSVLAQAAAEAALADAAFLAETYRANHEGMAYLSREFDRLGLRFLPSAGNFLAVDFSNRAPGAAAIFQRLMQAGFIVRPLVPYGLPQYLRITVGTAEQNPRFIAALDTVLAVEHAERHHA